ncbi:MAG: hypothetical protein WD314_07400 [Trueperaceae bacterium]
MFNHYLLSRIARDRVGDLLCLRHPGTGAGMCRLAERRLEAPYPARRQGRRIGTVAGSRR